MKEQDWESLSWRQVTLQSQDSYWGCRGQHVEEAESIFPRKKYHVAKASLGMPSALTPTFLTDDLI